MESSSPLHLILRNGLTCLSMNKTQILSAAMVIVTLHANAQRWLSVGGGILLKEKPEETEVKINVVRDDEPEPARGNGTIKALAVYNGALYVAGVFKMAGGKPANNIARWDGKTWSPVDIGIDGIVMSLYVYKNELYAGGLFDKAGNTSVKNIARWNGKTWLPVGAGINSEVAVLQVYKDELYAAGSFTEAGNKPAKGIARWNGKTWSGAGAGVPNDIYALTEYKGELYAGGTFVLDEQRQNYTSNLLKWNGKSWTGVAGFNGAITSLAVNKDKLCVSGYFSHANNTTNVSMVAETDGKHWTSVGKEPIGYYVNRARTAVHVLFSYNDLLYAGGDFVSAQSKPANSIASFNGTGWTASGTGVDGSVGTFAVYNGELYAGGSFINAGNDVVNGIARLSMDSK
jgi:hypothetical protein